MWQLRKLVMGAVGLAAFAVPAVVLAASSDDELESGSPEGVRYVQPSRTSPPTPVATGTTSNGRTYTLRLSHARQGLCIAVEWEERLADGSIQEGPLRVGGSEGCTDPNRPISAIAPHIFFDPRTGEMVDEPIRFVLGVVSGKAGEVSVKGPAGDSTELELFDVPGEEVKVFAGTPRPSPPGTGEVVASGGGKRVGRQPVKFVGPAHQSEAEAKATLHP